MEEEILSGLLLLGYKRNNIVKLRVRFHQATQFNSSSFMNFECTPSQSKQSQYFKFMEHPVRNKP